MLMQSKDTGAALFQLLQRGLVCLSTAYARCVICFEGSMGFLAQVRAIAPALCSTGYSLGLTLQVLFSTNEHDTKVGQP